MIEGGDDVSGTPAVMSVKPGLPDEENDEDVEVDSIYGVW